MRHQITPDEDTRLKCCFKKPVGTEKITDIISGYHELIEGFENTNACVLVATALSTVY